MRKFLLGSSAMVAVSLASQALAADMSSAFKAPVAAAAPFNWSGLYIGGVIGGALQTTTIDDKNCNLSCSSQNLNGSGFTGGGVIGWNYQFGAGLVGIEAEFSGANFKADLVDPQWSTPNGTHHHAEWDWFSTVRGRVGLTVDRALIYATGGAAFVDVNVTGRSASDVCASRPGCFGLSGVQTGLAAGFGAEYAFARNWTAKAEYLFIGLPSRNVHDSVRTSTTDQYNISSDAHILRVGVSYLFN